MTLLLLLSGYMSAQSNLSALLPMPNQIKQIESKKDFVINNQTSIQTNLPDNAYCITKLERILQERTGIMPAMSSTVSGNSVIRLTIDPAIKGDEHYRLTVSDRSITIKGATEGAILYGLMTLDQILLGDICRTTYGKIAQIEIDDQPRFGYRSLMLDPARHFLPGEDVKFYIDQMVRYKYNVLQLHLTDDQGWRIEIKKTSSVNREGRILYTGRIERADRLRSQAECTDHSRTGYSGTYSRRPCRLPRIRLYPDRHHPEDCRRDHQPDVMCQ